MHANHPIFRTELDIRDAAPGDLPAIQEIYAHHVLHGLASFEETPPDVKEMRARLSKVSSAGLPWIVALEEGTVLGYGYCAPYRPRSAYRFALEDSVYVRQGHHRKGVGRALLEELIRRCAQLGYRQLIAVIGDSAHAPSIGVHAATGFVRVGTIRSVGFKFGRWVDTVIMQRPLAAGDGTLPGPLRP